MSGAAIVQAAITTGAWVASAATSTQSFIALRALVSTPLVMPAIAVGAALAAIALVYNAAMQAQAAVNAASDAKSRLAGEDSTLVNHFVGVYKDPNSDAHTKALAKQFLHNDGVGGYASGGYTGQGSVNEVAGVVHKGEYVLPQSQVDQRTGTPKATTGIGSTGGNTYNFSGNIMLGDSSAVTTFFNKLDQDGLLVGKGLTPSRGMN
jgi:hypothetical protein